MTITAKELEQLNGDNIHWESQALYVGCVKFALTCAEFFDNGGDIDFIITLPTHKNEFYKLNKHIKDRFVSMVKSQISYFDAIGDRVVQGEKWEKLEAGRQESIRLIMSKHQDELEDFKEELMVGVEIDEPQSHQPEAEPEPEPTSDNEKIVMVKKIKELTKKNKAQSLTIQTGRPNKEQMMHYIDDGCRKRNGKCNNEAVGRKLGIDGETAKRWIEELGLSNYAYNPNHIETFHRKKK